LIPRYKGDVKEPEGGVRGVIPENKIYKEKYNCKLISSMYISNMQHFLDEQGNIPKQMPKEARELAGFFALVIDATTKNIPFTLIQADIRCFEKGCNGLIKSEVLKENNEIHWVCSKCQNEGVISGWQKTKWNNKGVNKS